MIYTLKQLAIMEFLQEYRRERHVSPTMEEMAENFQVGRVTIHEHIKNLESMGAIQRTPHRARSIEIVDPQFCDSQNQQSSAAASWADTEASGRDRLPVQVLGRIAAGEPIEAVEVPEQVDLADLLPMGKDHYALRVRGSSMIDDGIHDGDLVIVERREMADDGELVVAIVNEDGIETTTLKKMFREQRDGQEIYRLQPANQALEPIFVEQLNIRGVVVGVVRRYPRFSGGPVTP
ncbi:MAG: transcriptional repressor LexA [Planctomycetota bacterium]